MPRLAVLGHPVSHSRSPAMQNAALAELGLAGEWSYEAIEVVPERFADAGRARCPTTASPASTSPSRTSSRRSTLADRGLRRGARDRRRQHAQLRRRRGSPPRTPTRSGSRRRSASRSPAGGRSCSAPGARRGPPIWALREARAPRSRSGTAPRRRREALAAEFGVEPCADGASGSEIGDFDLIVNATTLGLAQASDAQPRAERPKGAPARCRCDSGKTSRGGPRLRVARDGARLPCTGAGRTRDRRARGAGPPRSRLASDLDRARPPDGDDAQARPASSRDRRWQRTPRTPATRALAGAEATAPTLDRADAERDARG